MRDLKSPKWIITKAVLFLILGLLAGVALYLEKPDIRTVLFLFLAIWSFCRLYYFAFYVVERYLGANYRFSGLLSFAHFLLVPKTRDVEQETSTVGASVDFRIDAYNHMKMGYLQVLAVYIDQVPHDLGEPFQAVSIELLKQNPSEKTVIKFMGVRDLRIANVHPCSHCRLEIRSVKDHQLEGIRYQVCNREQDLTFSFYCSDFETSEATL